MFILRKTPQNQNRYFLGKTTAYCNPEYWGGGGVIVIYKLKFYVFETDINLVTTCKCRFPKIHMRFLSVSWGISARLMDVRFLRGRTLTVTCWWSPRACRPSDLWTPAQGWKSKACPDQIQKPFMHLSKKEYTVKLFGFVFVPLMLKKFPIDC